jgi:hypothetical protein
VAARGTGAAANDAVVGFLHPTSLEAFADNLRGFRQA